MKVDVTSDGRLQLTDDNMVFPPLTADEVQALANAIPAVQGVVDTQALFDSLNDVTAALSIGTCDAYITVQGPTINVTANDFGTFERFADIFDVSLDFNMTTFYSRGVTVTLNTGD